MGGKQSSELLHKNRVYYTGRQTQFSPFLSRQPRERIVKVLAGKAFGYFCHMMTNDFPGSEKKRKLGQTKTKTYAYRKNMDGCHPGLYWLFGRQGPG
jgi:hypothetical protein